MIILLILQCLHAVNEFLRGLLLNVRRFLKEASTRRVLTESRLTYITNLSKNVKAISWARLTCSPKLPNAINTLARFVPCIIGIGIGIVYRYRKGKKEVFGSQWWETHSELMIVSSEMVLPLAITGIFTTSGDHNSEHAKQVYSKPFALE